MLISFYRNVTNALKLFDLLWCSCQNDKQFVSDIAGFQSWRWQSGVRYSGWTTSAHSERTSEQKDESQDVFQQEQKVKCIILSNPSNSSVVVWLLFSLNDKKLYALMYWNLIKKKWRLKCDLFFQIMLKKHELVFKIREVSVMVKFFGLIDRGWVGFPAMFRYF